MNAILQTLGVNDLNGVAIYAVQSDGTLDSNYKLGTTDGSGIVVDGKERFDAEYDEYSEQSLTDIEGNTNYSLW